MYMLIDVELQRNLYLQEVQELMTKPCKNKKLDAALIACFT
jgi:hypothetical protein